MLEQQTQAKPLNTEAWASWFEFDIGGDEWTQAQLAQLVTAAGAFVRDVNNGARPRWLSMLGSSGAGKTFLARRIFRWHLGCGRFDTGNFRSGEEVLYAREWCNWPELAGELQGNRGYDRLSEIQRTPFLVLDEIGADRDPNGHVRDCLCRLLSGRVGKWTVITSNKSLEQIANDIDTRVSSRMLRDGSAVVDVDVPDYALR